MPSALEALFTAPVTEVRLEIGFGGGEHLVRMLAAHPSSGFIGCEPFVNGVAKLLRALPEENLSRLRIHDDDARALLARLPDCSIAAVDLLYPDPWPKRRQRKRRFVSVDSLDALARVCRPGAVLRFATDIDDYAAWTLARVLAHPAWDWPAEGPAAWRQPFPGWQPTRYEEKARREGRVSSYLRFVRREAEGGGRAQGALPCEQEAQDA